MGPCIHSWVNYMRGWFRCSSCRLCAACPVCAGRSDGKAPGGALVHYCQEHKAYARTGGKRVTL
ncbi:hypothetical protein KSB_06580 [Ktedonobacter robiniae]|uniref:LIM zinc-binding domain-containing protein n=1 Tax=Ktedonobacter robiniae TaxID=2778365 RepID=A0ABQ3UHL0_9CHLR|nr:hypothetical protein KSB_06580 [Ktedonobacter robiniae]